MINEELKKYFKVEEVMPGFYEIGNSVVQVHLLVGEHHALLFDTGYGFLDLPTVIRDITELPLYVVNSHGHADHCCGNSLFHQPVYIHPNDIPVFKKHNTPECRGFMYDSIRQALETWPFLHMMPDELKRQDYIYDEFHDFIEIREGEVFDLGGITAEVIELPGHTPGSIGLYCRELRLLFTTDAINAGVYLFLPESNQISTYIESLRKAMQLDFDYFITGHVPELLPKKNLEYYLETAENLDFEKGIPQPEHVLAPGAEIRICVRPGKSRDQEKDPDYAVLVISRDKL